MLFRKNINSLRALAVSSVVLFHFDVLGFSGGFIGVDVFFVISGFLMTGIIVEGLQQKEFSLWEFYASRARRIIPALLVLCAVLLVFGFVYLPLDDYRDSIKTIKSSLFFGSNFLFSEEGDYFDSPLHGNWLLHTWSLSVEWQFYMIYPLLLIALVKCLGPSKTRVAIVFLAAVSFVLSIGLTKDHPVFSFYMLPVRAWELLAGGLIFFFPLTLKKSTRFTFEGLGLVGIAVGISYLDKQDAWPGYLAVIPVLSTVLIIYGNTDSLFSNSRILQFAGKISYSVYLWHWPLVVFLYTCGLLASWKYVSLFIFASFVLGALSYYLVELRVKNECGARKVICKYLALTGGAVAFSAVVASLVKDYPGIRFAFLQPVQPEYVSRLYSQECYPNEFGAADCKLGSGNISVILFGDSHAQSTAAAVQLANKEAALSWARGGCPTLLNFKMHDKEREAQCLGFNQAKLDVLKSAFPGVPVVLFSRAGLYTDSDRGNSFRVYFDANDDKADSSARDRYSDEYVKMVCAISENRPVYIVKPIPEMPFNIYKGLYLQSRFFSRPSDIAIPINDYEVRNKTANMAIAKAAKECGADVIDPTPLLCPEGMCLGSRNGVPLYFDDNHLVDDGNVQLEGLFKEVFTSSSSAG